jgi:hypothetical protein
MSVDHLSDKQLDAFEANYRRANRTEGGKYTLAEILLEKRRRRPSPFGVRETAAKIIELAAASDDGLTTYGDLWSAFRPGMPWEGHKTQKIVSDSLYRVIHYCVTNRLPIITVLVVRGGQRKLSKEAIANIYRECRELAVDVGRDPEAFVSQQIELSRRMRTEDLPHEK